jgi:hypothetical protein
MSPPRGNHRAVTEDPISPLKRKEESRGPSKLRHNEAGCYRHPASNNGKLQLTTDGIESISLCRGLPLVISETDSFQSTTILPTGGNMKTAVFFLRLLAVC